MFFGGQFASFKMFLREGKGEGLERLMLSLNYGCTEILGTACSVVRRWSATLQRNMHSISVYLPLIDRVCGYDVNSDLGSRLQKSLRGS